MGNESSKQSGNKEETLIDMVDLIATNYILESKFRDMKNLARTKYCDELVILTSKVIASNLNDMEIKYLGQRMKDGKEVNFPEKDRMVYLRKKKLDKLDISNPTKKRRVCVGIAKYYVKIAHLFAAIITTINPVYVYKDKNNVTKRLSYKDKGSLPKGADYDIETDNICDNRLNALKNNKNFTDPKDGKVTVAPKICGMNSGKTSLNDEPGIPEFAMLFNDIYDEDKGGETEGVKRGLNDTNVVPVTAPSATATATATPETAATATSPAPAASAAALAASAAAPAASAAASAASAAAAAAASYAKTAGSVLSDAQQDVAQFFGGGSRGYNKMSDAARKSLQSALEEFHLAFTGNPIPKDADGKPTITKARQIPLNKYSSTEKCAPGGLYSNSYDGNINDKGVFANYAGHLKEMMQNTETNRNKLMAILKEVFIDVKDPNTKKITVSIHPKLTEASLQLLIDKTRELIIKIYVDCEKDFIKGLHLFDAIIEKTSREHITRELSELHGVFLDSTYGQDEGRAADEDEEEKEEHDSVAVVATDDAAAAGATDAATAAAAATVGATDAATDADATQPLPLPLPPAAATSLPPPIDSGWRR